MAFQSAPNCAEVVFTYALDNELCQNTFHYQRGAPYDQGQLTTLINGIETLITDEWLPLVTANVGAVSLEGKGLTNQNDVTANIVFSSTAVGGLAVPAEPNNVAKCYWRKSGLTGRSARGRVYIGGIAEGDVVNSRISATRAAQHIAMLTEFISGGYIPGGNVHVILSRFANNVQRPTAIAFPVLTYGQSTLTVASQRDRLPE